MVTDSLFSDWVFAVHRAFQLIDHTRVGEVRLRVAVRAAFQAHHIEAGISQLFGHDGAGPAHADNHGVYFVLYDSHIA
jgi:hypothetical protein